MNESEDSMKVGTPLYLITSMELCWKCGRPQEVIALASGSLADDEGEEATENAEEIEPFILNEITGMPAEVFQYLAAKHPRCRMHYSRTVEATYFTNFCECGANFGDFYLHCEPGAAFFPDTEEDAAKMTVEKLPFGGVLDFVCTYSQGLGGFIFKHAKRI